MKKQLLVLSGLLMLFSVNQVQAQAITNGGFETWVTAPTYEVPVISPAPVFGNSNDESYYQEGILTMTKITGTSGFGLRVENKQGQGGDTLKGYVSFGQSDQGHFSKGIPIPNGGLTGLSLYLRYSVTATTPGFVAVIPMKNGSPVSAGNGYFPGAYVYPLTGSHLTSTLTTYTFAPALSVNPDSCVIFITAADMLNDKATIGDFVEVDELTWLGNTNPLYGGALDVWQNKTGWLLPDKWGTNYGGQQKTFAQSTDAKFGTYSLELFNIASGGGGNGSGVNTGQALLGHYECSGQNNCTEKPGMKLVSTPTSMALYYKYSTPGVDTAACYVSFFKNGVRVGGTYTYLYPSANWKYQYISFAPPSTVPDSAFISFEAGRWQTAVVGSNLKVDGLKFNYCDDAPTIQGPITVCAGSNGTQYIISEEFASGYSWSTTTGVISAGATNDTVTIDNIAANGMVSVIKTYADGCPNQTFNLNIGTVSNSSSNAGADGSYCKNNAVIALNGSVTGATGGVWSGGAGTYDNSTSLTAHYTPTVAELTAGTVTLTLTPTGTGGCAVASDNVTYNFTAAPTANAGSDNSKCGNNAVTSLTGTMSGSSGVQWTTLGSGTFSASTSLTTNYTPSINDTQSGSVRIVLATSGNGNCNAATDTMTIAFTPAPTVTAGPDQSICTTTSTASLSGGFTVSGGIQWSTSGTGTFDNNTSISPVYTPSIVDVAAGSVTITASTSANGTCAMVSDQMTLTMYDCTGLLKAGIQDQVTCYPNPTSSQLLIDLGQDVRVDQVEIMNVTQNRVKQIQVNDMVNQYSLSMDGLDTGMYTILVRTSEGVIVKKVVKQ